MKELVIRLDEGQSTLQIDVKGSPEKISQFIKDLSQFTNTWVFIQKTPKPPPCKSCGAE